MKEQLDFNRLEALKRQKILHENRCIGCPYRPKKGVYTEKCYTCPVRDEFLEIGEVLIKTV